MLNQHLTHTKFTERILCLVFANNSYFPYY